MASVISFGSRERRVRVRRRWLVLALVLALVLFLWIAREPLLTWIGRLVVEEAAPQRAALVVILGNPPAPAAEEAATLVKNGYASRVLVFASSTDTEDILDRLGIVMPRPHEVAVLVLGRMGVPPDAIAIEHSPDGGTNSLIRATAKYARQRGLTRLIVITPRSHTRRTEKLLKAALGSPGYVIARAPVRDRFQPDRWWRDRDSTRELLTELLGWFNSFVLGDLWRRDDRPASSGTRPARSRPLSSPTLSLYNPACCEEAGAAGAASSIVPVGPPLGVRRRSIALRCVS